MKTHTTSFKENINIFGRELDSKITYTLNNEVIELGTIDINSITPHYEGGILKTVMKQLDIDTNVMIPVGTIINYQFGLKINDVFEYIDFGNYIVYSIEEQKDTRSYKIICYDKMLYTMKDYTLLPITYPITIKEYTKAICDYLSLNFASYNDTFVNYDKEIPNELYLDENSNSLGYSFRDVLDEIAGVTASTICINDDDELEIRYINDTEDTIDEGYLKNINVDFGEKFGPVNSIVLSRAGDSDSIFLQDEESIEEYGLCEIKISDNQIMNRNDRDIYLPEILEQLRGLEYYINDFSSVGVCYYNVCDKYNVSIDNIIYPCIMLNDEINITQGLEELIYTKKIDGTQTDYSKADKTDRKINQAYIIVDKVQGEINTLISKTDELNDEYTTLSTTLTETERDFTFKVEELTGKVDEIENNQGTLKNALVTIDINGIHVATDLSKIETEMTNNKFAIKDNTDTYLAYFGYDETEGRSKAEMDNLTINNYFTAGYHRQEKIIGENRTGWFYVGGGN